MQKSRNRKIQGKRKKDKIRRPVNRNYLYATIISAFVYMTVMSYLSIIRYESCTAGAYDLGIMIQTVWNTSQGWFLQDSINMGYPMMRFWMAHWEFIYIIIALFYAVFSTPYTILIFQSAMVAAGALPIFWLGRDVFKNASVGFAFASCYLLFPAIQNANLIDVHGVTLAAPVLAFCFYFLYKRSFRNFALAGTIALSCREDSALLLIMMGIYAFFFMKEKKVGVISIVLSALWFLIWYERMTLRSMFGLPEFIIMEGAESHWSHLSQTFEDFLYPLKFLAKKQNIEYFLVLLGPVIFLSLFSLETFLIAAPILGINLISSYHYTHDIQHYYSATITPFIFVSAILGSKRLLFYLEQRFARQKKIQAFRENALSIITALMIVSSLIFFFIKSNVFEHKKWKVLPHHKTVQKLAQQIPEQAKVTALNLLVPHVAERHEIYVFDDNVEKADYIFYDFRAQKYTFLTRESFHLPFFWPYNERIDAVLRDKSFGLTTYEDGVFILKRGANYEAGLQKLAYASGAEVAQFKDVEFGREIKFIGYRAFEPFVRGFKMDDRTKQYFRKMVRFTSYWTATRDNPENYKLIYKIHNAENEYIFEHVPVLELFPSSKWIEGELVRDEVFWVAPQTMEPGMYTISVALKKTDSAEPEQTKFNPIFEYEY